MRTFILVLLCTLCADATPASRTSPRKLNAAQILAAADYAAHIWVTTKNAESNNEYKKTYLAGFAVLYKGKTYVITAGHVVPRKPKRAIHRIRVAFKKRRGFYYEAKLIALHRDCDTAILAVTDPKFKYRGKYTTLGNSDLVKEKQRVYVIGHPGDHDRGGLWRIKKGRIISTYSIGDFEDAPALTEPLITHNCFTKGGSSGGLVLNEYGQLVAMHIRRIPRTSGRLAVPINAIVAKLEILHKKTPR